MWALFCMRRSATRLLAALAALCVSLGRPMPVAAQSDTVRTALELRNSGRFAGAASLLRAYLAAHPTNGEVARLLSETLYWAKNSSAARAVAEASLVRHPEDASLRLQYGRMLVELGDATRAREVLGPLRGTRDRGRAAGLLGTLAYWDGDLTEARAMFVESLRAAPDQPEIRRQLGEILELSTPWVGAGLTFKHDDQPIDVFDLTAEAGWFATPLVRFVARLEPMLFRLADSATRTVTTAEIGVSDYVPPAHAEVEVGAGGLQRSFGSAGDWRGRAGIGFRLPGHLTLRARGERSPYLYTEASLSTPVMTTTGTALAQLSTPGGWLAEAALQTQRFPDANSVSTAYAWVLAPVIHNSGGDLELGYSGAHQDAAASRFVLARTVQPFLPGDPRFDFSGRYAPYYTPSQLTSHSMVGAATGRFSSAVTLRVNGSYALHAAENATTFVATGNPSPQQAGVKGVVARRAFTPWNAHAALELAGGDGLVFATDGEITRTAFYTVATVGVRLTYRFGLSERRRAAGY